MDKGRSGPTEGRTYGSDDGRSERGSERERGPIIRNDDNYIVGGAGSEEKREEGGDREMDGMNALREEETKIT